jgi:membrane-bound lytic murein transglycosylase D
MLIKAGSTLLVPRSAKRTADVPEKVADNATMMLAPEAPTQRRLSVKVGKRGESVASVARRYRVSAEQVALWNKVPATGSFRPGQVVTLLVAAPARSTAATRGVRTVSAKRAAKPAAAAKKHSTTARSGASVKVARD